MPAIRFPSTATPLLSLCKNRDDGGIFKTHADLMGFLAAYGFHLVRDECRRPNPKPHFTETPGPISLEVFENRGFFPNILMMAITLGPDTYAKDDDLMVELVEQLADLGGQEIAQKCSGDPKAALNFLAAAIKSKDEGKI